MKFKEKIKELRERINKASSMQEMQELKAELNQLLEEEKRYNEENQNTEVENNVEEDVEERELLRTELLNRTAEVKRAENRSLTVINREEKKAENEEELQRNYTTAFAKKILDRKDFTADEMRALEAITTTSKEFVPAQSSTLGINNGGLLIPKNIMLDAMERVKVASPFLEDLIVTNIPGLLAFPYAEEEPEAKFVEEGKKPDSSQIKFGEVDLSPQELVIKLRISWKLKSMAVNEFIEYLTREITKRLQAKLSNAIFYGTGNKQIKGATIDAIKKITGKADPAEAIKEGLDALKEEDKALAKVYVSSKVANRIVFGKDKNGSYLNNPFNSMELKRVGINDISVDGNLKENDILIGVPDYYKLNFLTEAVEKIMPCDDLADDHIIYQNVGGAPIPKRFVHIELAPQV